MFVARRGAAHRDLPVHGTIARGTEPIEDPESVRNLPLFRQDGCGADEVHRRPQRHARRGAGSVQSHRKTPYELDSPPHHTVDHVEASAMTVFDASTPSARILGLSDSAPSAPPLLIEKRETGPRLVVWRSPSAMSVQTATSIRPHLAHLRDQGRLAEEIEGRS